MEPHPPAALAPYRVLDLTDERGLVAGLILADLGADVIAIEPPGGSPVRLRRPYRGREAAQGSLWWEAFARNRRSVTLDLEDASGREDFLRLVTTADILIESYAPGHMAALGLGYEALSEFNPGLVMTSVTPFGQTGPKAHWPATDLTVLAASNYLIGCGDEDRAPLRIAVPQAYLHAGGEAAVATLVALHERNTSGLGQHVDVSAQQATAFCTLSSSLAEPWGDAPNTRMAGGMKLGIFPLRLMYPAKDGFVAISFFFGSAVGPATARLMRWIHDEGECGDDLRDKDWVGLGALLMSGQEPFERFVAAQDTVAAFTAKRTKAELFAEGRRRRILLTPVSTVADLAHDPHLEARQYWQLAAPEAGGPRYPGPFAKLSATPVVYRHPPSAPGEHTAELLRGLPPAIAFPKPDPPQRRLPLDGLKVLDFTWVMVGPATMRTFADFGATVIKVESSTRVDTARTILPFKDRQPGPERSAVYANYNAGKLGLTLNLGTPAAREVVKKLAAWADVIAEAFTPRVMRDWGLDYEALRALNPGLIYLSTCLGGASGPYSDVAGFGNLGAGLAGFTNLVGWPDRPPAGPAGAYTDYVAPRFMASAVLAALDHRARTGEGQLIDLSQAEAAVHFLAPAVLDWEVNGHLAMPDGNRDEDMAPHGVFRCEGQERWVAVAVPDDAAWRALLAATGDAGWPDGAVAWDFSRRKLEERQIEHLLKGWMSGRAAEAVQETLIAAGVPAHVVADAHDIANDPQLAHRDHYVPVAHAELGEVVVEGPRFSLSATPGRLERAGPVYGQDTNAILGEILGLTTDEIAELAAAGALQ